MNELCLPRRPKKRSPYPRRRSPTKIGAVKKSFNLSDRDFDGFLQNHAMMPAAFEKRMEKDLLISKLLTKGMQENGLTQ